ncbi:MAG: response regulator [Candidatus Saccharibacteria bacterium]|nr:response regulator [Candidatus Saccharibacteria bacterium]
MARVLLIEPDAILARNYEQALGQAGHAIDWAKLGQEAVQLADVNRPDIIILELQLAEHNGIEFLYEFRSYTDWQDIPIILLTMVPESMLPTGQAGLDSLGVARYLYKPQAKLQQVVSAVERTLQSYKV